MMVARLGRTRCWSVRWAPAVVVLALLPSLASSFTLPCRATGVAPHCRALRQSGKSDDLSGGAERIAQEASERVAARVQYDTVSEKWIGSSWDRRATKAKAIKPVSGGVAPKYTAAELREIKEREANRFQETKYRLVIDNVVICLLLGSAVWSLGGLKEATSYMFGGLFGTMYLLLLSRFVENLGGEGGGRSNGSAARLGLVVGLMLICGKNRETFNVIYALSGFLTYQVSSLVQGVYRDD